MVEYTKTFILHIKKSRLGLAVGIMDFIQEFKWTWIVKQFNKYLLKWIATLETKANAWEVIPLQMSLGSVLY